MRIRHSQALVWVSLVAAGCSSDAPTTTSSALSSLSTARSTRAIAQVAGPRALGPDARAVVASADARGVPRFVFVGGAPAPRAAAASHDAAARWHAGRYASLYGLTPAALGTAYVHDTLDTGRGGIIVRFRQRVDGLPVIDTELKVVMTRGHELVALSGSLHAAATPTAGLRRAPFALADEDALAAALAEVTGVATSPNTFVLVSRDSGGFDHYEPAAPLAVDFGRAARVRRVLAPAGALLEPAFEIELDVAERGSVSPVAHRVVVAGDSGKVLARRQLTVSESYQYRVWADPTAPNNPPMDGPMENATPHPTGNPDGFVPDWVAPGLFSMEGFNTNPDGGSDPWLPDGATESTGNNVDAYADHFSPDGFSDGDLRATVTGDRVFDRVYDVLLDPVDSDAQIMAAVIQIFYTTNWMHDFWYDSGFDEAAGNAQQDNYGRGGADGDALRIEAQDTRGQQTNNANMSTFGDGSSPRMQMYLWSGEITEIGETTLTVTAPSSIAGDYPARTPEFGSNDELFASGDIVLVDDGMSASTACEGIVNDVTGKIALIDRGSCTFVSKAAAAQGAGAIGVIIANNNMDSPDALPPLGGDDDSIAIPVLGVSFNTGATFKGELATGVTADMNKAGIIEGLRRDGTIDNGIVAHEWGHYIHNRLVACGSQQCGGQGEGWGDFMALHLLMREGDDLDGVYAVAGYSTAILGDSHYFGIRRVPYSVNFDKNALTFRHIQEGEELPDHPMNGGGFNNAEVHNAGEIWASMMFEAMIALLKESEGSTPRYSWTEGHRRTADYVVGGMMAAPTSPTFTEQRDGILAAAAAADRDDLIVVASAFARRGAGTGAVSPPSDSSDLVGVVESYVVKGDLAFGGAAIAEGAASCDADGVLDAGEAGAITVDVLNTGVATLTNAQVTLAADTAALSFPDGDTFAVGNLEPFASATVEVPVALADDVASMQAIGITVTVTDAEAATPEVEVSLSLRVDYDEAAEVSATDDVETETLAWDLDSDADLGAVDPWRRAQEPDSVNHVLFGPDPGSQADERAVSPALQVSADTAFVVTFDHRFKFEASSSPFGGGEVTYWDGGVIEISTDGGATWDDVSTYVDPGYGGTLTDSSGNPLGGRLAFVDESAGYPAMSSLSLDFGDALAGQTVQLRFRIGADGAVGDVGWEIDNLAFAGIDNTPFGSLGEDQCMGGGADPDAGPVGPGADAGPGGSGDGDGGGCGCRTSASSPATSTLLLLLGVTALLRRRRRR